MSIETTPPMLYTCQCGYTMTIQPEDFDDFLELDEADRLCADCDELKDECLLDWAMGV